MSILLGVGYPDTCETNMKVVVKKQVLTASFVKRSISKILYKQQVMMLIYIERERVHIISNSWVAVA